MLPGVVGLRSAGLVTVVAVAAVVAVVAVVLPLAVVGAE